MEVKQAVDKADLVGSWAVYNVTELFKGCDDEAVGKTLEALDSGDITQGDLIRQTGAGNPDIHVDIAATGEMAMKIVQSMRPGLPAMMQISATMKWELNGNSLCTETVLDKLAAKVSVDPEYQGSAEEKTNLSIQIAGIETGTLQSMKGSPPWNAPNTVSVAHWGKQHFLTRSSEDFLMLHCRE